MSEPDSFASRLKAARDKRDWSQGDLAQATGIDRQLLSKYERGVKLPSVEGLVKLAKALKCSTDYLLGLRTDRLPKGLGMVFDDKHTPTAEERARIKASVEQLKRDNPGCLTPDEP